MNYNVLLILNIWLKHYVKFIEYNISKSVRHPNAKKVMDENVRGTYW